uniref:Envelope glycoprotein gB n=2 Tax=unclassified Gammaherpesvirinae TaxID=35249 RepID=A0A8B6T2V1_9GAMA|nr:Envelope glycoprotein gB [Otarine gammaherpesvirus 4]
MAQPLHTLMCIVAAMTAAQDATLSTVMSTQPVARTTKDVEKTAHSTTLSMDNGTLLISETDDESRELNDTMDAKASANSNTPPFRICGASSTGDIFRFHLEHQCPDTSEVQHDEGILVVFKTNVIPFMFNVRKYRKAVTTTTVYNGVYADAITNQFTTYHHVPLYEAQLIDTKYMCHSAVGMTGDGNSIIYTDRDLPNTTVPLKPIEGLTHSIVRYASQPRIYAEPGWLWGTYRRRTTVNCEVVDMTARSIQPFKFFVTAVGDTIEVSPFWTGSNNETEWNAEGENATSRITNYTIVNFGNRDETAKPHTRTFVTHGTYTVSWHSPDRAHEYCPLALWRAFHNGIRTHHETSLHFVANDVTASFSTPPEQYTLFDKKFQCAHREAKRIIAEKLGRVAGTYHPSGPIEYYHTSGGLYIAWQPLVHTKLRDVDEAIRKANKTDDAGNARHRGDKGVLLNKSKHTTQSPNSRNVHMHARRSVNNSFDPIHSQPSQAPALVAMDENGPRSSGDGDSYTNATMEESAAAAQIQFAYDRLRVGINGVLQELSRTWCREQNRATMMWNELSKINPTSVMTAIYGRPVSARRLGDVISVSHCVNVDQDSVSLHSSMRIPNDNVNCYSRPPVSFRFINDTSMSLGQLGTRNEILLTNTYIEKCRASTEHYFQAGDSIYIYKNYEHVRTTKVSNVATLDTFIALNLTLLENIDFETIEIYSRSENALSGVFDLETMFRDYNYYTQRLYGLRRDLDNSMAYDHPRIIEAFGELVNELGDFGVVVLNGVSSVVSLFGSIVSGFISFFKNPVGGLLIILALLGVVVVIVILLSRQKSMATEPVRLICPDVDRLKSKEARSELSPINNEQLERIMLAMHNYQQQMAHTPPKSSKTTAENNEKSVQPETQGADNRYRKPFKSLIQRTRHALRQRGGYQPLRSRGDDTDV